MYKTWLILLLLISLHSANAQYATNNYGKYVFVSGGIIFVGLLRHIVLHTFRTDIPYAVFAIFTGILCGVAALYTPWMEEFVESAPTSLHHLAQIYLPVLIYSTTFCTDMYTFIRALPQVLIIAVPVFTVNALFCGMVMRLVINTEWNVTDGLMFGVLLSAVYPLDMFRPLREVSSHTKHVAMYLKGEMIASTAFTIYFHEILMMHIQGWIVHWYQFVCGVLRVLLLGFPLAYLCGLFGAFLMRLAYNEPVSLILITISMCYLSFSVCETIATSGTVGVVMTGILMGIERRILPTEIERSVTEMWKIIGNIMNGLLYLVVGVMGPIIFRSYLEVKDYIYVFVTYLMCNLGRLLGFLIFSPILRRIGYGLSFKSMIVCIWGGLKNPIDLSLSGNLDKVFVDEQKVRIFFAHTMVVYMLFLLINGTFFPTVLRALGLSELSLARQVNMNNCIKHIKHARERMIAILKMDKFLSDANWPLVNTATTLRHPYKDMTMRESENDEQEEEEEFFLGYRFAVCSECKKSVPTEPTNKEMREMTREARMRVLKLKKIAYSRQYQSGMLSKEGLRILHQAVEIAMDSEEAIMDLNNIITLFGRDGSFHQFLKYKLFDLLKSHEETIIPPRQHFRFLCYRLIINRYFKGFIYCVIFLNVIFGIYGLIYIEENRATEIIKNLTLDAVFFIIYVFEFVVTIYAYSWISVCKHGFGRYFRSGWHIIDFIVLCSAFLDFFLELVITALQVFDFYNYAHILTFFCVMRLVRVLRFLQLLTTFDKPYHKMMNYLERKINKHRAVAYELGKNIIAGEDEIIENLPYIVDNEKIRSGLREKSVNDRLMVSKLLGIAQKERNFITVSVKTKLALRMVLNGMREDLNDLKSSGWVDEVEFMLLRKSLAERHKYSRSIESIEPPAPKDIFRHVCWMGDDKITMNFLYKRASVKKFEAGDVVFKEGTPAEGIYILTSGLFKLTYTANAAVMNNLNKTGALPVVDYVSLSKLPEAVVDYIVPGNSVGELSTLTERPYNCVIMAETHCQVYVLNRDTVLEAINKDPDPVNGLECRLWKNISYAYALPILLDLPTYRSITQDKIKFIIERSFIPDISNYKVFNLNDMIEDVILIEGMVVDAATKKVYIGPCDLPRTVQKINLPKRSTSAVDCNIETRLLIIPAKDFDEYEIMVDEEEMCEMVSEKPTKCLQHLIQQRGTADFKMAKLKRRQFMNFNKYFGSMQSLSSSVDRSKLNFENKQSVTISPRSSVIRKDRLKSVSLIKNRSKSVSLTKDRSKSVSLTKASNFKS